MVTQKAWMLDVGWRRLADSANQHPTTNIQHPFLNIDGPQKENTAVFTINFMVKPNEQLVTVSSTCYHASTSVLSNRLSTCALVIFRLGDLILGKVSRLYAFSVYPNRTSLPSYATGVTTGSQEVRSSRSSRTKDKPPQISYAHHR